MKVRARVLGSVLIAASLVLAGCGGGDDSGDGDKGKKITVATQPDFFGVPLYFAVQKGFLKKQGLDAKLQKFPTGVEGTEAVATGQADFTTVAGFPVVSLAARKAQVKVIGHNATSAKWWGFVTDGSISKPSDLEGKTVGFQSNSTANYWFDQFVAFHKLDRSKIKIVDAKFAQLVPTFAQGKANAIIHFEPNVSKAVASKSGAKVTWWGGDDNLLPFYGYVAAGPKVYKDKDTAMRVLRGLRETAEYMKNNEAEVIKLAKELTGMTDDAAIKEILAQIDFSLAFDPKSVEQVQQIADYQLQHKQIKERVDAQSLVEASWVSESEK
ncbi:ABC transporter substrate-binding protein [Actinomadura syzygii]|uniref:ABC transporter substrate-binding protein n=1 Tax=Actinomadura syzygii TaxID=1427538 RepID=A0A5D0U3X6_9ACTN|nr:ABC transporter substrate-binding protein [Actinomadura syzygii]TYC13118.1 ABC transporter substrate-binding protein [Actinomadura syzygii]